MRLFLQHTFAPALSLFTSASTLVCCALPALLVSLGMGAVMAGLASSVPELIWLSENKKAVFIVAALLLAIAGLSQIYSARLPCPVEPNAAKWCTRFRTIGKWVYVVSVVIYLIGAFFAFFAAELLA